MSTNRELLELAAKAAGYTTNHPWNAKRLTMNPPVDALVVQDANGLVHTAWDPLTDDGAALRLAVKLGISITPYPIYNDEARHSVIAKQRRHSDTLREANPTEVIELHDGDPAAAVRRAIVRCAAEIGKAME